MTEFQLQKRLTRTWLAQGAVRLASEQFLLAAWEVMSDYRINDAHRHWSLPSIDFLLLDADGRLAALELKPQVATPKQAWLVLCQVTHRAAVLGEGYTAGTGRAPRSPARAVI